MSRFSDQKYLKSDQYKDSSNLDARVTLHKRFSTNPYSWMNWVFDSLLTLPEDATVLELGCGPAYLWKENLGRIPSGWRITLSDLSSGMLDVAWRNLKDAGLPDDIGSVMYEMDYAWSAANREAILERWQRDIER